VVWCPVVVVGWRSGGRQRGSMSACGMVSCCSGGLAVRRAAAWSCVLGVKEDAAHAVILQSYAPDDGQMFFRNMLS
jgi:hypothetical protein